MFVSGKNTYYFQINCFGRVTLYITICLNCGHNGKVWNYCTLKHNVTSPDNMKWGRSPQGVSNTTQTLDLLTNGWFCHQFKLKNIHKVFTKYVPKHQSFPFSQYKHTEIIKIFHKIICSVGIWHFHAL